MSEQNTSRMSVLHRHSYAWQPEQPSCEGGYPPKEAEARHLGSHNATDNGAAVQPDAHLDGHGGHRIEHFAGFLQQCLDGRQAGRNDR